MWGSAQQRTFDELCKELSSPTVLAQYSVKYLISLLGNRAPDDLPPRILRFRLRLLRFTYKIEHVPGKKLITADALSRALIQAPPTPEDKQLEEDMCVSINLTMGQLPASEQRLEQIRTVQDADYVSKRLKRMVQIGWPLSRKALSPQLQL